MRVVLVRCSARAYTSWAAWNVCLSACEQELLVMVAFILHLGNVSFEDSEGSAVIASDETVQIIDSVSINL